MVARWSNASRRRWGAGAAGLVLATVLAGCVPFTSSGPSGRDAGVGTSSGDEQVIVCQSEVVDENGVKTSSKVVTRVPAGTPVPPGCHLG